MTVSRRLRFEVFRRDDHACRYCGGKAPDVKLTIDHVLPVALGGEDTSDNLVTACAECNSGKTSIAPGQPLVDAVSDDAVRWAAAIKRAGEIQAQENERRLNYIRAFDERWCKWTYTDGTEVTRPNAWVSTVGRLHDQGLELVVLLDLVDDVLPRNIPDYRMWQYFCGAVRNVMKQRAEIAAELLAQEDGDGA